MKTCIATIAVLLLFAAAGFAGGDDTAPASNLVQHTAASFDKEAAGQLLIVDFYADWCGPCVRFAPTFKAVAADLPHIRFVKVNTDKARSLASRYKVRYIPFIAAIKDGKLVARYKGNRSAADFRAWSEKMHKQYGKAVKMGK